MPGHDDKQPNLFQANTPATIELPESQPGVKSGFKKKVLFDPSSGAPFKLSRTKLEKFIRCPHCFYLDLRHDVVEPSGPQFTLNMAVDTLLKKEFDTHRAKGQPHPLMAKYGIEAVPFAHEKLEDWRTNWTGVQYLHATTNFLIFGAIDDVWINSRGELHVVDYKATASTKGVSLDDEWKISYKRQMEIYQWLMAHNDFKVSAVGYFVYVNGLTDRKAFDAKLEFDVQILPYEGSQDWVEPALIKARDCLVGNLPEPADSCELCRYRREAESIEHGN